MTLREDIIEEHTVDGQIDKEWLRISAHDGCGFIWFGEYEDYLEKIKDDAQDTFEEIIHNCILEDIERKGGWEYTFFENLSIDKALEISQNITLDNNPWVADVLYKGKSLCECYGWPAKINPKYGRVAKILDKVQGLIKNTCEIAYRQECEYLLENLEEEVLC